ncbi:regulatory LuxR family protein [Kribbella orskensis]|uniref:Regulatory LuxR family protein n=1 Tax=Kribbella orskensis TaxID=2512216 RepID=A0ABY2BTX5_9ACTN|nr:MULTISPECIES: AAA family ATPase [Kribbella]TCN44748.1 regulatory LuxR family protein [Kribbella sp. VKM Ac-2500]TCO31474.1 regulatory LuxR family protein [Kribbella orskensis]
MAKWPGLRGRASECEVLSDLVTNAQAGRSQVLVLRGEAGIGKTALLRFLLQHAADCRVSRAAGVESEMELAFAGLHQLCAPFLNRLDELPAPQHDALATTFGLQPGNPPDRFVVGLAVLTLLSDVAERQPLICVIDDAQWLDQASAQTLEFVARRLSAERVVMAFAVRTSDQPRLTGLPELELQGLAGRDAAALLESAVGPLDDRVRGRVLAEAHGNPLALLELPRQLSSTELAFEPGHGPASDTTLISRLEEGFLRQLQDLPEQSRRLLLLAAVEPVGDVDLLRRAAQGTGLGYDATGAADTAGLVQLGHRVEFRHPLVRSVVYRAATAEERRTAHQALADVMNPDKDPDRRAWHRARAAAGPDETVAAELEQSADRAQRRGGVAAAAAFLEAAATLTPDPARRAQRSLAAAQAKATAGAFDDAMALLAVAQSGPLDEAEGARVQLQHAQISQYSLHGNTALPLLLAAARRLEPTDPKLARETYLDALAAAMFAGRLASGTDTGMRQVAEAMRQVQLPAAPSKSDLLLQGVAVLYTDGYAAAAPGLLDTVGAFGHDDLTVDEAVRFAWLAACAATDLWDDANWGILTKRHLNAIRDIGALGVLPVALNSRIIYDLYSGDLAEAEAMVAECELIAEATGGQNAMIPYGEVSLNALRGRTSLAEGQFKRLLDDITARGEGVGLNMISWFQAIMCNSLGRYDEALVAARTGAASPLELGPPKWALAELVEAGVRSGNTDEAAGALEQLASFAQASGTEAALGVLAGRNALLRTGDGAEACYREEIERLGHTTLRVEHARARLRYGEWLRREDRRTDARAQLRTAYETLHAMGVDGFAERARKELSATGEVVHHRTVETSLDLTSQEAHIARLAAEGLTNPEIGAALFISPRTVEWHLRKVFSKVGVTTRRQLRQSLPASVRTLQQN